MKKIDNKVKVCFMTATYQNYEGLRAAFPTIELECYIQKPVAKRLDTKGNRRVRAAVNHAP
jgi:hypothetical protein